MSNTTANTANTANTTAPASAPASRRRVVITAATREARISPEMRAEMEENARIQRASESRSERAFERRVYGTR